MTTSAPPRRPLRRTVCYISIGALALLMIVGIGVFVNVGWASGISALGAIILIFLFALSILTALATTQVIPWNELSWSLLQEPRVLATIGAILLSSFGTVGSFLGLLKDKGGPDQALTEVAGLLGSIKEDTKATRETTDDMKEGLKQKGILAGEPTAVEKAINGVWGQQDCSNTYRFQLSPAGRPERTLTVKSLKSGSKLASFDGEYAFKSAHDVISNDGFARSILSTEETKGFEPGFAVDFTLVRSGSSEKLIWGSKSKDLNAPELVRCSE